MYAVVHKSVDFWKELIVYGCDAVLAVLAVYNQKADRFEGILEPVKGVLLLHLLKNNLEHLDERRQESLHFELQHSEDLLQCVERLWLEGLAHSDEIVQVLQDSLDLRENVVRVENRLVAEHSTDIPLVLIVSGVVRGVVDWGVHIVLNIALVHS